MAIDPRHKSHDLLDGPGRAPARAMLKAVGFTDADLERPLVGVANTWIEVMPCNYHLRRLSERVKSGIRAAGGTPIEYNTIAVSDGISMGTEGMKASLISREVIADSIELVARGHLFDGVVALSGCDKTIPGTVMALCRLNIPSLMLYGGSIMPGQFQGHDVTIQDVFEAVGKHAAGSMTNRELKDLEDHACPGPGACGGQFTANTMAIAFEFLGMSPMGRNGVPAMDQRKDDVAFECGKMVMELLKRDLRPRQIITRKSLENAIAAVATTGGSTNAVLHLLAIAYEAGIKLNIDDFDRINRKVPLLADLKPGGKFAAADLYAAGGTTLVAKRLVDAGLLHANQPTVSGRTIGEEAKDATETAGQRVLRPLSDPIKATGGLVILKGNLAPEGCVVKVAGHSMMQFRGPARVYEREEDAFVAVKAGQIKAGDVVVIRYEGPSGGPGMREMLGVTAAIVGAGLGDSVALLT
ncbi:MAG TPA: dihydroxy-acid dehydratase, partial [Nitrospiraceae bacterium]|nr:dihydroxy-acid dehydratase [Nitrospiraceae bacterium]